MTTANKITIFRILLVPFLAFEILSYRDTGLELHRWLGLASFFIAAVLDGVDGYVARHYHQRSELGAVLDPLADKLLLVCAIVLLSLDHPHFSRIPLWLITALVSRDLLLLSGAIVIYITCGKTRVRPRWTGKTATVLQMILVVWIMLKWPSETAWWIALAATVFTVVSGLFYLSDGIQQLNASPRSAPSPMDG